MKRIIAIGLILSSCGCVTPEAVKQQVPNVTQLFTEQKSEPTCEIYIESAHNNPPEIYYCVNYWNTAVGRKYFIINGLYRNNYTLQIERESCPDITNKYLFVASTKTVITWEDAISKTMIFQILGKMIGLEETSDETSIMCTTKTFSEDRYPSGSDIILARNKLGIK